MVQAVPDEYLQARVSGQVAAALAQAGQYQNAEAAARTITYPSLRAGALADVAMSLAQAGHTTAAARLTAETCTLSEWTTAAKPVLLLEPAALATLADVLSEQ